jgi:cyclohexyl-isocyanide hydratase
VSGRIPRVAMIAFPGMQPLDFFGPYDLFDTAGVPVFVAGSKAGPVQVDRLLSVTAEYAFEDAPEADVLFVPGGHGVTGCLEDEQCMRYLRTAKHEWITSVCTGALLLAAAGLLRGYRATTHWRYIDLLELGGAIPVRDERIVTDRNRITGGGVTAGVDFGVALLAVTAGEETARLAQLALEYEPSPPYGGHPTTAQPETVEQYRARTQARLDSRRAEMERSIARSAAQS